MAEAQFVFFPVVLVNVAPIATIVPSQIGGGFFARRL